MNTFDKIDSLLKEQKRKQVELTTYLGIPKSHYTDWKNNRTKSYKKYILEIATFFNVSVDYLLGKTIDTSFTTDDQLLSEIVTYYNQCDMIGKSDIYQFAKTRAEQQKLQRKDS